MKDGMKEKRCVLVSYSKESSLRGYSISYILFTPLASFLPYLCRVIVSRPRAVDGTSLDTHIAPTNPGCRHPHTLDMP